MKNYFKTEELPQWEKVSSRAFTDEELATVKSATVELGDYGPYLQITLVGKQEPNKMILDPRSEVTIGQSVDLAICQIEYCKFQDQIIPRILI